MIREVHFAKVLDNDDPEGNGGLKVQVDALEEGTEFRGGEYIPPSFPFAGSNVGFFFLPEKGAMIEVEVESDPEKGTEELGARWRAVLYTNADKIPSEFLSDQTKRGGIKYGDGVVLFDQAKDLLSLISNNVRLGEEDASHPLVRGDTYNLELVKYLTGEETGYLTAEDVLQGLLNAHATAVKGVATVWKNLTPAIPATTDMLIAAGVALETPAQNLATGATTYRVAITAFKVIVAAFKAAKATWLSTKCKTE